MSESPLTKDDPLVTMKARAALAKRNCGLVRVRPEQLLALIDSVEELQREAARYESARIVLGLELKNLRERLARAEDERDQYKLAAELNAETIKQMSYAFAAEQDLKVSP